MAEARFYQGVLIRYQGYHDDYACSCGGAAMSDGDVIDSSTHVHVVRCVWVPVAMSHRARHSMPFSPEDPTLAALSSTEKPIGVTAGGSGTF
jgi:hypothetical protein